MQYIYWGCEGWCLSGGFNFWWLPVFHFPLFHLIKSNWFLFPSWGKMFTRSSHPTRKLKCYSTPFQSVCTSLQPLGRILHLTTYHCIKSSTLPLFRSSTSSSQHLILYSFHHPKVICYLCYYLVTIPTRCIFHGYIVRPSKKLRRSSHSNLSESICPFFL